MLYAKIFSSIYDGTISVNWKGLVTFQQLLVLSEHDGTVDMTPPALSRRTGIPLEIIEEGLRFLQEPDPYSRSPGEDGRRIIPIDPDRNWGWKIVNFTHYKNLISIEDKRAKDAQRMREKRAKSAQGAQRNAQTGAQGSAQTAPETGADSGSAQNVAVCRKPSQPVANVAQLELEKEIYKKNSANAQAHCASFFDRFWSAYPNKKDKKRAMKAMEKINPDGFLQAKIIDGLDDEKAFRSRAKKQKIFCPEWKHPATWLNGECWTNIWEEEESPEMHDDPNAI